MNEISSIDLQGLDEDLLNELLKAELPYEFVRKRHYDFLVVQKGFIEAADEFFRDKYEPLLQSEPRPLVIQVRAEDDLGSDLLARVGGTAEKLQARGKPFRIYPRSAPQVDTFGDNACDTLAEALHSMQIFERGKFNSEILEGFCISARTAFEIQARTQVKFSKPELRSAGSEEGCISGSVEFAGGGIEGSVMVSMEPEVLSRIAERMMGSLENTREEDIWNVASEMINIISGHGKTHLNELGYELDIPSLPSLITPPFQSALDIEDDHRGVIVRMDSDLGVISLEVRFFAPIN